MRTLAWLCVVMLGCGGDEECVVDTSYDPVIEPANFVAAVTNPLYPLAPGTRFEYVNGDERVQVEVLAQKETIMGVSCTVVHDVATVGGEVIEDTLDWFAQDRDGAVWYFGEDTKELDHGTVVSTEGSWRGGVDGAKPGLVIPAAPTPGVLYKQEYSACNAEDLGKVISTSATAVVPLGSYASCLETEDTSAIEDTIQEHKFYCPGVGLVLSVDTITGDREELVVKTP